MTSTSNRLLLAAVRSAAGRRRPARRGKLRRPARTGMQRQKPVSPPARKHWWCQQQPMAPPPLLLLVQRRCRDPPRPPLLARPTHCRAAGLPDCCLPRSLAQLTLTPSALPSTGIDHVPYNLLEACQVPLATTATAHARRTKEMINPVSSTYMSSLWYCAWRPGDSRRALGRERRCGRRRRRRRRGWRTEHGRFGQAGEVQYR